MRTNIFLLLTTLFFGCSAVQLDTKRIIVDNQEYTPLYCPQSVFAVDRETTILVQDAIAWWDDQVCGDDCDLFEYTNNRDMALITVEFGEMPMDVNDVSLGPGEYLLDLTTVYARGGYIHRCEVVLNRELAWNRSLMFVVTRHSLGHCQGLSNDAGPPTTVDTRSIMASPIDILGEVTEQDRGLIRVGCGLPN